MKLLILFIAILYTSNASAQTELPHLKKQGNATQLIVHGKPYLILGGELGNSSATSMEYMEPIWPKIKALNINTVLAPVFWELMEPEEGVFDFSLIEDLILEARNQDLKLILLWFGSWKNSTSTHVPSWVKLNQNRFPKVKDESGNSINILTPFSRSNLEADKNAFIALMSHLKYFDSIDNTVVMIQVENEIATLPPSVRDYHPLANTAFESEVPSDLITYLSGNKDILVPEFKSKWEEYGFKTKGTWEEVFGIGDHTDEYFMAWHFSKFVNELADAGKEIYPLPMFVNAALKYPNGGPLPHLMDVWKAGGSGIDFLSPDFYNPNFKYWNDLYIRQGDPLFIPEHRFDETVDAKALYTFANYEGLGFSPFSIESNNGSESENLSRMYAMIDNLQELISENQGKGKIKGVLFDEEESEKIITLGNIEFTFRHDYTLGWDPNSTLDDWPYAAGIIIQTGDNEYIIAGNGIVTRMNHSDNSKLNIGILSAEEGVFENRIWKRGRRLNGDQIHQGRHIRIPFDRYTIQKVEFYTYK